MAILNNLISSLRSTKKQKRELQDQANPRPPKRRLVPKVDNLSPKEKNLLEKLNSAQNPQDFKSLLSKINSLAVLEKIRPFIIEHKDFNEKGLSWVDNIHNDLLFQKIVRSSQINEEVFEALEKLDQEDKVDQIRK